MNGGRGKAKIMYCVYVLKSKKSEWIYIGYTADLNRRLKEHKMGKTYTTSRLGPMELVYYEAFTSESDAKMREKRLKQHGASLGHLKKRINGCLSLEMDIS